jgi:hypothetical protein
MLSVTALIECNDERGEGTSLRSEVKKLNVTSHQKLRISSKMIKKVNKKVRYTRKK